MKRLNILVGFLVLLFFTMACFNQAFAKMPFPLSSLGEEPIWNLYKNSTTLSISLPQPVGRNSYQYLNTPVPELDSKPELCRPIGLGRLDYGLLDLMVSLPAPFSTVDLFLAIFAPVVSNEIFLFGEDNSIYPISMGIRPWRQGVQGPIDETVISGFPISRLPLGLYRFYLLVASHEEVASGALNNYYLWSTGFIVGICQRDVDLGLDIDSVANSPSISDQGDFLQIGTTGSERARTFMEQYMPSGTFCDVELTPATEDTLQLFTGFLDSGDVDSALKLMDDLLSTSKNRSKIFRQATGGWRENIKAAIQAWESLTLIGETGLADTLAQQIKDYFFQNALNDLQDADLEETLRILKEAALLGLDDVENQATQRVKNITRQGLEATLEDFNPCIPNPDVLHHDIGNLLDSLRLAILAGVPEADEGGELYSQVMESVQKAVEVYNNLKMGKGLGKECGLALDFELEGASGFATLKANIHSCSGIAGPWQGTIEISFSAPEVCSCQSHGEIEFVADSNTLRAEGITPMSETNCQMDDPDCYFNYVSETISYQINFSSDGTSAEVTMGSSGQGKASITCCDEECWTLPDSVWTIFWGANTANVKVTSYPGCNSTP